MHRGNKEEIRHLGIVPVPPKEIDRVDSKTTTEVIISLVNRVQDSASNHTIVAHQFRLSSFRIIQRFLVSLLTVLILTVSNSRVPAIANMASLRSSSLSNHSCQVLDSLYS